MAEKLRLSVLTRAWQMLLKGLGEARMAPDPRQALEMIVIRLVFAAELPTPADVIQSLKGGPPAQIAGGSLQTGPLQTGASQAGASQAGPSQASSAQASSALIGSTPVGGAAAPGGGSRTVGSGFAGPQARRVDPEPAEARDPGPHPVAEARSAPVLQQPILQQPILQQPANPQSFAEAVQLFVERREATLHTHLRNDVHLVRFEAGRIELAPGPYAPSNLANRVGDLLSQWTGRRWVVSVANVQGQPTLREQEQAEAATRRQAALRDPLLQAALRAFPGATVETIREPQGVGPAHEFDSALEPPPDDGDISA
jgi:DNA polymerase-3 subunit gamma/tau